MSRLWILPSVVVVQNPLLDIARQRLLGFALEPALTDSPLVGLMQNPEIAREANGFASRLLGLLLEVILIHLESLPIDVVVRPFVFASAIERRPPFHLRFFRPRLTTAAVWVFWTCCSGV